MFRYILITGVVLVALMTFQLYEVSYNTNDIRGNIKLLKAEISKEKENINILRFKLNQAQRPENIKRLTDGLLKLQPQQVDQFTTISQLPAQVAVRLPEPVETPNIGTLLLLESDPIADLLNQ
ncbi:MAG: hypothetical protein OCD03_00220 [Hyphomicrobiales bacterium]